MTRLVSKDTKLQYNSGTVETPSWTEIPDVKTFPSLIGDVGKVDTSVVTGDKTYGAGQADVGDAVFKFGYSGQASGTNFYILNTTIGTASKSYRILYPDGSGWGFDATQRIKDEGFDGGEAPIEFSSQFFISSAITPFATST